MNKITEIMYIKKCIIIILCFLCVYPVYLNAQEEPLEDPYFWDFGKVKEGQILEHKFFFKNNSAKTIKIEKTSTSCGCTLLEIPKKELMPEESIELTVQFNTKGYQGPVEQFVYIYTDNPDNQLVKFRIKAEVLKN